MKSARVAIVHDWLVSQRGGENVLDAICELFPQADVYTLVYDRHKVSKNISSHLVQSSFLQKIPQATQKYPYFLPLMPWAIESFNLKNYDLILSSSHCVAKGVIKSESAYHVSYVHAPMRYMWDRFDEYFNRQRSGWVTRTAALFFRKYLQRWDRKSAHSVDAFLCNSKFIGQKIKTYYQREAEVVYPFCNFEAFQKPRRVEDFYLMVTALVPYKRVDFAIKAFNQSQKKLVIIGDGPDRERLEKLAGPTVKFMGSLSGEQLASFYSRCRGLIFPGVEDFGIVPLEAMAAGAGVIAFGQGGLLETVTAKTGVFFNEPTIEALNRAIESYENSSIQERDCRMQAKNFSRVRFQKEYLAFLKKKLPTKIWSSLKIADSDLQLEPKLP